MVEKIKDEYGRSIAVTHSARYIMEHRLLPQFLYEEGIGFMSAIATQDNVANEIFKDVMKQEGVENPYGENPISVNTFKVENILVAGFVFPKPEDEPLCYRSYALFDIEKKKAAYYCLEKGDGEDAIPFLCAWDEEFNHWNMGNCIDDEQKILIRIFKNFIDSEGAIKLKAKGKMSLGKKK